MLNWLNDARIRDFTLHLNDSTIILTFYGRDFVHDENSQCLADRDFLANSALLKGLKSRELPMSHNV
jgi:hypothetical protein